VCVCVCVQLAGEQYSYAGEEALPAMLSSLSVAASTSVSGCLTQAASQSADTSV